MDEGSAHGNFGRAVKCHVGRAGPRGTRPDVRGVWALSISPTRTRVRGIGREKKVCGHYLFCPHVGVWAVPLIHHTKCVDRLPNAQSCGTYWRPCLYSKAIGPGSWHKPRPMHPLVPVGATNQDQRPLFSSPKGGKRRPLVPVGGTNRD